MKLACDGSNAPYVAQGLIKSHGLVAITSRFGAIGANNSSRLRCILEVKQTLLDVGIFALVITIDLI